MADRTRVPLTSHNLPAREVRYRQELQAELELAYFLVVCLAKVKRLADRARVTHGEDDR